MSGETKDIIYGRHGDNNCSHHIAEKNWASSAMSWHSPSLLHFWGCKGGHHSLVHTWHGMSGLSMWPWKWHWTLSLNHVYRSMDGLSCRNTINAVQK